MTLHPRGRDVIGPVFGRPGHMWGVRILARRFTKREPVAWIYANGLKLQVGLRPRIWFRRAGIDGRDGHA